ncbi:glycine dehydrogenase [Thecamonas trahens ATCC 50062]|uniref:Glycine cleavage system P protein n=1 Tax=Thecamonas trahens ATCC 50062 TaxID=461836 RepID=A0A0L0DR44_THETB|nr:glycine dehydrogenase [Thecamonas trahens ATCC 50062]KNC54486.1 glycine dehydrogenase [Thecamonas trahens ATCC 50062]|eukprot:XP_013753640.1 glycine dehydrogenase [Thecamonas trahens ATCC 50062]
MWRTCRVITTTCAAAAQRAMLVRASSTGAGSSLLDPLDTFPRRHHGRMNDAEVAAMLEVLNVQSVDQLMNESIPAELRATQPLELPEGVSETQALAEVKALAAQNQVKESLIGMGYYGTVTPPVILRNIVENPNWYTPYTPYQAEISQGRMESLVNFQQMVSDLTGLPVANASLLDEGTAAAEAMAMAFSAGRGKKRDFFVDRNVWPQTLAVLETRAKPLGINIKIGDVSTFDFAGHSLFGGIYQYPDARGIACGNISHFVEATQASNGLAIVATDLLACSVLKPPGEFGADIVLGNSQRFGVPLGYGGPHAAFFAVRDKLARKMPGRLIGVTRDSAGKPAFRLTLQTREQHIRREKATSNICTAQALLANVAAMYAVYHGPAGLRSIASRVHAMAAAFAAGVAADGKATSVSVRDAETQAFFDTVLVRFDSPAEALASANAALAADINVRVVDDVTLGVAFDETCTEATLAALLPAFGSRLTPRDALAQAELDAIPQAALKRESKFLTHAVFNRFHTEHELLRYMNRLQSSDIGLQNSMIPLGSCTMKLNATAEMIPVTLPGISAIHPFAPLNQVPGYAALLKEFEAQLCAITGFSAFSLQPNSGAAGEYAGLYAIRAYHEARGETHRNVCLIPDSAHGTNPASAAMSGMKVVAIKTSATGEVDLEDAAAKIAKHGEKLGALMVTYPSTYGVFEAGIKELCAMVKEAGGRVYMDGANMNAQVGLMRPTDLGADVLHLNLHKTMTIPHGGGGPGMGPIGVVDDLVPFLPSHPLVDNGTDAESAIGPVASAPWSSASILPISYMYIRLMGSEGLTNATQRAILHANYMAARLEPEYKVLFSNEAGRVAHEFIVDLRPLTKATGVEAGDVAKRLQDFGFHAPTMSWPVAGTIMIEPTESETKEEMDRYIDSLLAIRSEIADIEAGRISIEDSPLRNAPHTADVVTASEWNRAYSREQAAFPLPWVRQRKFWPKVGRVDDVFGDRNLVCTCPPMEDYVEADE